MVEDLGEDLVTDPLPKPLIKHVVYPLEATGKVISLNILVVVDDSAFEGPNIAKSHFLD